MVVESDEEGSKKALKKTQLNFLSSQDEMYLNYIFGFTWAAAAVHEVLLADGFDDQDLMAGTCKDVLHGILHNSAPPQHSSCPEALHLAKYFFITENYYKSWI